MDFKHLLSINKSVYLGCCDYLVYVFEHLSILSAITNLYMLKTQTNNYM